ncbi:hypothetical protein [Sorangium sp. So ce1024]|uniref:hypothetical protein n=1 Tax=Sorangium sp. So ce1024 TaxID=3133327 RepID=UPI003F060DEE
MNHLSATPWAAPEVLSHPDSTPSGILGLAVLIARAVGDRGDEPAMRETAARVAPRLLEGMALPRRR